MVERKTEVKTDRISDDKVDMVTTITERFTNKEFSRFWNDLTKQKEILKLNIKNGEANVEALKKQQEVSQKHIDNLFQVAEECKARNKT